MNICTDGSGGTWAVLNHSVGSPTYYEYPYLQHVQSAGAPAFAGGGGRGDIRVYQGGGQGGQFGPVRKPYRGCIMDRRKWNPTNRSVYRQGREARGSMPSGD